MKNVTFEFDFLVFIGRFQPFHKGHAKVLRQALESASQVIILAGSAHQPRSTRNPGSCQNAKQWCVPR